MNLCPVCGEALGAFFTGRGHRWRRVCPACGEGCVQSGEERREVTAVTCGGEVMDDAEVDLADVACCRCGYRHRDEEG